MEKEIFEGRVEEQTDSGGVAYLLKDNEMFYDIGFKVMQNQEDSCLLPCHRLKYNGKIKLVYFTESCSTLREKLEQTEDEYLGEFIAGVLEAIRQIEGFGFLDMGCVDGRLDHMYAEHNTNAIRLIYLPVNPGSGKKTALSFENEIRAVLVQAIHKNEGEMSQAAAGVVQYLTDGTLPLADLIRLLRGTSGAEKQKAPEESGEERGIVLKSMEKDLEIPIQKTDCIIGKSKERADAVIDGNPAVSRVHCKIVLDGAKAYVVDLGSSNGTYVNGQKIRQGVQTQIEEGSRIRLANMEFIVVRR